MLRRLLLVLPALAAAIVAWAVLTAGGPRRTLAARVLGGPALGRAELSVLVRAVESDGGTPEPRPGLALRIEARSDERSSVWRGTTDATGHAEARLDFGAPLRAQPWISVKDGAGERTLAEGTLALDTAEWRAGVRRQGGWLPAQREGELAVRVAPARGTLAVPFPGEIVVQVLAGTQPLGGTPGLPAGAEPVPGASVEMELEGADALAPPQGVARTDAGGSTLLGLQPIEHAVTLRVAARDGDARSGRWYGALPTTPGAFIARLDGERLSVSSPVPRDHAFVSFVSADARLAGAVVPLVAGSDGGASGELVLAPGLLAELKAAPSWAVVSSEYDKRSPAVVGWPLTSSGAPGAADAAEPALTFDAPDRLLLDGMSAALEAERSERLVRRRWAAGSLLVIGLMMGAVFWLEVRGKPGGKPGSGLIAQLIPRTRGWIVAVAIVCVMSAVLALAWFGAVAR